MWIAILKDLDSTANLAQYPQLNYPGFTDEGLCFTSVETKMSLLQGQSAPTTVVEGASKTRRKLGQNSEVCVQMFISRIKPKSTTKPLSLLT